MTKIIWQYNGRKEEFFKDIKDKEDMIARFPQCVNSVRPERDRGGYPEEIEHYNRSYDGDKRDYSKVCSYDFMEYGESCGDIKDCYSCSEYVDEVRKRLRAEIVKQSKRFDRALDNSVIIFETIEEVKRKDIGKFVYVMDRNVSEIFKGLEEEVDYTYYSDGVNLRGRSVYEYEDSSEVFSKGKILFRKLKKGINPVEFKAFVKNKKNGLSSREIVLYTESLLPNIKS